MSEEWRKQVAVAIAASEGREETARAEGWRDGVRFAAGVAEHVSAAKSGPARAALRQLTEALWLAGGGEPHNF